MPSPLSTEQSQQVSTFQSITETSYETALKYLEKWNWNLERAAQDYFDSFTTTTSSTQPTETTSSATPTSLPFFNWIRPLLKPLSWGWHFFYSLAKSTLYFLFGKPFYSDTLHLEGSLASQAVLNTFETFYGNVHPEFFQGSYSEALDKSKRESKWMLAILYHPQHQDTDTFCRKVLSNTRFIDFLNQKRALVWMGDMRTKEAHQVAQVLNVQEFPIAAIIGPQGSSMKIYERIQGIPSLEPFLERLKSCIQKVERHLRNVSSQIQQRETSRSIREEQDEAYLASLRADQEKERLAQLEREKAEKEAKLKQQEEMRQMTLLQKKKLRIQELKLNLPMEPLDSASGITKLSIRLPSGERIVRRFYQDDTLESVQNFVETCTLDPIPFESDVILVNTFPRKLFTDLTLTLKEAQLVPNASIIVEEKLE